jgi:hypothetical protein
MTSRSLEELLPYVPRLKAIAKDIEQRAMADLGRVKTSAVGRSWPPNPAHVARRRRWRPHRH